MDSLNINKSLISLNSISFLVFVTETHCVNAKCELNLEIGELGESG
jgi:hypothetical protein